MKLILVEREKLRLLVDFADKCHDFAKLCRERVNLLEDYRQKADGIIKKQEEQLYVCKEELHDEKQKKTWIWPVLSVILGVALGGIVF